MQQPQWSAFEITVWWFTSIVVWSLVLLVLFRHRRVNEFAVGVLRATIHVFVLSCSLHDQCAIDRVHLYAIQNQLQNQWVALSVQLLSLPLPAAYRFVAFILVDVTLTTLGGTKLPWPYPVVLEYIIVMLVIPMNWVISTRRVWIPWREPLFWGPILMLQLAFLAYIVAYSRDLRLAVGLWQYSFNMALMLAFVEKNQWVQMSPGPSKQNSRDLSEELITRDVPLLPQQRVETEIHIGV